MASGVTTTSKVVDLSGYGSDDDPPPRTNLRAVVDLTVEDHPAPSTKTDALARLEAAYSPAGAGHGSNNRFNSARQSASKNAASMSQSKPSNSDVQSSRKVEFLVIDSDDDEPELPAITRTAPPTTKPSADPNRHGSSLPRQSSTPRPAQPDTGSRKRPLDVVQHNDGPSLPADKRRRLDIRNGQSRSSSTSLASSPRFVHREVPPLKATTSPKGPDESPSQSSASGLRGAKTAVPTSAAHEDVVRKSATIARRDTTTESRSSSTSAASSPRLIYRDIPPKRSTKPPTGSNDKPPSRSNAPASKGAKIMAPAGATHEDVARKPATVARRDIGTSNSDAPHPADAKMAVLPPINAREDVARHPTTSPHRRATPSQLETPIINSAKSTKPLASTVRNGAAEKASSSLLRDDAGPGSRTSSVVSSGTKSQEMERKRRDERSQQFLKQTKNLNGRPDKTTADVGSVEITGREHSASAVHLHDSEEENSPTKKPSGGLQPSTQRVHALQDNTTRSTAQSAIGESVQNRANTGISAKPSKQSSNKGQSISTVHGPKNRTPKKVLEKSSLDEQTPFSSRPTKTALNHSPKLPLAGRPSLSKSAAASRSSSVMELNPGASAKHSPQTSRSTSQQDKSAVRESVGEPRTAATMEERPKDASQRENVPSRQSHASPLPDMDTQPPEALEQPEQASVFKTLEAEMLVRIAGKDMAPPPHRTPRKKKHLQWPDGKFRGREVERRAPSESIAGIESEDSQQEVSAHLESEMESTWIPRAAGNTIPLSTINTSATPPVITTAAATSASGSEAPASDMFATPRPYVADEKSQQMSSMRTLSQQVEHIVGRYLTEMREDTEYYTKHMLKRARLSPPARVASHTLDSENKTSPQHEQSKASLVFASLPAMEGIPTTANSKTPPNTIKLNVETHSGYSKPRTQAYFIKPTICDVLDTKDVPGYAHYVSLKGNLLAPNTLTMNVSPYFGDDYVSPDTFHVYYYLDVKGRERKLRRLLQSQRAEVYAMSALEKLQITWTDVLHFILNDGADAEAADDPGVRKAIANRDASCKEDFPRSSEKWAFVRSAVEPASPDTDADFAKMSKAALLCDIFEQMFKLPLWHVARRSKIVTEVLREQDRLARPPASIKERTCRICLRFNCQQHGEYRETEGSDSDVAHESDEAVATDLVHPRKVNFRKRIPFRPLSKDQSAAAAIKPAAASKPAPASRKDRRYWDAGDYAKADERGPFYPCDHPGTTCDQAQCSCYKNSTPCEKTCGCPSSCLRKFQGCSCSKDKARRPRELVCFNDDRCACYQQGRECDPDLCGTCGVIDVLDPVNRHKHDILSSNCRNASLQRGVTKHTLLGDSGVHGMGLYACETIKQDDFVGEYKGEVITKHEADRRGAVYEHQNLSYLFSLNKKQEVDSTVYGNKMRFINHRDESGANVYARIMQVNTVHRIVLFGLREVKPGQELFFDYGPQFPDEALGGKKKVTSTKSAPHVRNANITRKFYDVEEEQDEAGNLRARKASSSKGRGRPRKPSADSTNGSFVKKRGGARPRVERRKSKPELSALTVVESDAVLPEEDEPQPSPGRRLAAYNVADEPPFDDKFVDAGAGADADEDDDFDPDESEDDGSADDSEESSEGDDEDVLERPRRGRPSKMRGGRGFGARGRF